MSKNCVDSYIGEAGCQNETRGGGGVNAKRDDYWQHVYVAFKPISFVACLRNYPRNVRPRLR